MSDFKRLSSFSSFLFFFFFIFWKRQTHCLDFLSVQLNCVTSLLPLSIDCMLQLPNNGLGKSYWTGICDAVSRAENQSKVSKCSLFLCSRRHLATCCTRDVPATHQSVRQQEFTFLTLLLLTQSFQFICGPLMQPKPIKTHQKILWQTFYNNYWNWMEL